MGWSVCILDGMDGCAKEGRENMIRPIRHRFHCYTILPSFYLSPLEEGEVGGKRLGAGQGRRRAGEDELLFEGG